MEMSIDEAISHLYTYSSTMGSGQTTQAQHEDAKRVAVETMRKYQKITEIVAHYRENVRDKVTNENMEKILEVVEDGKDN